MEGGRPGSLSRHLERGDVSQGGQAAGKVADFAGIAVVRPRDYTQAFFRYNGFWWMALGLLKCSRTGAFASSLIQTFA